ncbi:uncharacterized protein [Asterias amurensis]|uniref:uncharacterized protein n=1 Tax=Asterias amurensis TaxID=7602 RepID=UPI003AB7D4D3
MDVIEGHCFRCEKILPSECVKCTGCPVAEYCSKRCLQQDKVRHGSVECLVFGPKQCERCKKRDHVQECSGCNNASYCSKACQTESWVYHKQQCKPIKHFIKDASMIMSSLFTSLGESLFKTADGPAYIGNTFALDFLQLPRNEWSETGAPEDQDQTRDYNILSAGCGDLRSTVLTLGSLPATYQGNVHMTLDDFDPFVMARNAMFLFMMVRYVQREGLCGSLATIWYSVHISESDYNLIRATLKDLVKENSKSLCEATNGVVRVDDADLVYMREVWEGWLTLECERSKDDCINLRQQRKFIFEKDTGAQDGLPQYLRRLSPADMKFMKKWFDHGLFVAKDTHHGSLLFDNPTLTGRPSMTYESRKTRLAAGMHSPKDFKFVYCIGTDSFAFKVWDCLRVEEFTDVPGLSVMVRYHRYVSHLLQNVLGVIDQGRLSIYMSLANCLDFPNHHLTHAMPHYDRIFTSNIADLVGHAKLLKTMKPLLNVDNKYSVIVTQTMNWIITHTPDADVQNTSLTELGKAVQMCSQDTGWNRNMSMDVNNHREYFNNTHWFLAYLRADIMGGGIGIPAMDHVPTLNEVKSYNGMQMRDFRKVRNRLVPFQYRSNARKIALLNGMDRNVEWYLPGSTD